MKVQCDICAGVVSTNTYQKYVCRKRNSMGPPGRYLYKSACSNSALACFTELIQWGKNIYRTMELLKVMVFAAAFFYV